MQRNEKRYRCATCGRETADYMDEYYSFGVYAGRYCNDICWTKSGYRDAVDPTVTFDPMDAGERLDEEEW